MPGNNIFTSSELALSSYAPLLRGNSGSSTNLDGLKLNDRFAPFQAEKFAERFPDIIGQWLDGTTGFSVTVFKDSGQNIRLAFRGTSFSWAI